MTGVDQAEPSVHVCPECGTPVGALPVRPPRWIAWKRVIALIPFLLALLWIGRLNVQHWPAIPAPVAPAAAVWMADFPSWRFTRADLERIAAGELTGPSLMGSLGLVQWQFGAAELHAGFAPPEGHHHFFVRYGWPLHFLIYRYDADYEDVYGLGRATSAPASSRQGWLGWTHVRQRIDERGRRESRLWRPDALLGLGLLLIAPWWLGAAVAKRLRRAGAGSVPVALVRSGPALVVLLVATVLSMHSSIEEGTRMPRMPAPATAPTGLTVGTLTTSRADRAAEAAAARAILEATRDAPDGREHVLVYMWRTPVIPAQAQIARGWPAGLLAIARLELPAPAAASERPQRWPVIRWGSGWLLSERRRIRDDGGVEIRTTSVSLSRLSVLLVVLWMAWVGGRLAWRLWRWRAQQKQRRRWRRQQCLECGYPLDALAVHARHATTSAAPCVAAFSG
jgi:hypothetical protein